MLSICKKEVDNLDMKYIINDLIKSVDGNCGKECRQTLLSAQYVKGGFTSGIVVYVVTCRW